MPTPSTSSAQKLQSTPLTDERRGSDDQHLLGDGKPASWLIGFRGGVRLARNGTTLVHAGFMLEPTQERHKGLVMGWRVANAERDTPMVHSFNEGLWGAVPTEGQQ